MEKEGKLTRRKKVEVEKEKEGRVLYRAETHLQLEGHYFLKLRISNHFWRAQVCDVLYTRVTS